MNEYEPPADVDWDLRWGIPRWALVGGILGGLMLTVGLAAGAFALTRRR